jgi:hypothetical protein
MRYAGGSRRTLRNEALAQGSTVLHLVLRRVVTTDCPSAAGESILSREPIDRIEKGTREMRVCHDSTAVFDDPKRVSCAGLAPVLQLAERAGLQELVAEHVDLGQPGGVNPHLKIPALVAARGAGADSIDDMALLRHGAMKRLFTGVRAPSTLGTFCARSRSATSGSSTRSRPGCWSPWPGRCRCCPAPPSWPMSTSMTPSSRPTVTPSRALAAATPV